MCKMYEFPKQLDLPEDEKEMILLLGEAYAVALYNSLLKLVGDDPTREKMEEVGHLVNQTFTEGMKRGVEITELGF